MNISFSGCGFAGLYHLGVARCLREHAPNFVAGLQRVAGASAGSLAAVLLVSGMAVDKSIEAILKSSQLAQSLWMQHMSPFFDMLGEIEATLSDTLPDDAHKLASGRLFISLTSVSDVKNVLVSEFSSKKELIEAILASCFVPIWASIKPRTFRGKYYMDGGFTDNLPHDFPGETITVCPFSGDTDICPKTTGGVDMTVNVVNTSLSLSLSNVFLLKQALLLPDLVNLVELMRNGYNDCLKYLQFKGLDECTCHYDGGASCKPHETWEALIPERLHHIVRGEPALQSSSSEKEELGGEDGFSLSGAVLSRLVSPITSIFLSLGRRTSPSAQGKCSEEESSNASL